MFNINKRKLRRFIESDRYKNNKRYAIQLMNNKHYLLKDNLLDRYVDLKSPGYSWSIGTSYFNDCKGTIDDVIAAFNFKVPIIEEINSLKDL